ncbi:MAG: hypothetical protein C4518_16680 [Desulfobacteraceae bacterium]|nr:MAG: hypothetical protein C4518_16680 [Desulfobacteraceae bacterium]
METCQTKTYQIDDLQVIPEKQGADHYVKISYPFRYGRFSEIKSGNYTFQFNLNGEIKSIQGRGIGWLDAAEWLKRTAGNDWVYFAAGGYTGAFDFTGEYYVPCLPYDSNGIFGHNRFDSPEVTGAFELWDNLRLRLNDLETSRLPAAVADFVQRVVDMDDEALDLRAQMLHDIIGGPVSVLPPDTRHVEYDVIPLNIADGCLYNCGFCRVKSGHGFKLRKKGDINQQLHDLRDLYNKDLSNYHSLFLGQHDALFAGADLIEFAAIQAFEVLEFDRSFMKAPKLFLFGSVDALLRAEDTLFARINALPFESFINIGLESADPETLKQIEKPLSRDKILQAFNKMMDVNRRFPKVEVTANFLYGADLPDTHLPSILELTRNSLPHFHSKGAIYLSPLENIGPIPEVKTRFFDLKSLCRLPVFFYLIQRL